MPNVELPGFVEWVDKNKLKVRTSDWRGEHENIVTEEDLDRYISRYAGDITSTYRCLSATPEDICGDWRMMDELVSILKDIYRQKKGLAPRPRRGIIIF